MAMRFDGSPSLNDLRNQVGAAPDTGGSAAAPGILGPPSGNNPDDPYLWMRVTKPPKKHQIYEGGKVSTYTDPGNTTQKMTTSAAQNLFYSWSPEQRNAWGDYLASIGLIPKEKAHDFYTQRDEWGAAVDESAKFFKGQSGARLDPWAAAKIMAGDAPGGQAKADGGGPKTVTQKSTSIDLTDPETAKGLINDTLTRALGRAATPEELSTFRGILRAGENANPTHNTTVTTYNADGTEANSSSTSSGGLSGPGKQQLLLDQAMLKPEYGAYQAAGTYMNALIQAIQSPVHI